jgi:hypothetical protein
MTVPPPANRAGPATPVPAPAGPDRNDRVDPAKRPRNDAPRPPSAPIPAPSSRATTVKACDFLTKTDAEALLGATVQDRSQGFDCRFVETGWTNKPPMNKAIRFGVSEAAAPDPDAVIQLRRNAEQYLPPGGAIRDIGGFADAAYWLWIPGFGGTLTAFQRGTVTVSVNITGLPEQEALQKAEALASKPLGSSRPTGYAYRRAGPELRAASETPAAQPNRRPASATIRTFCSSDPDQPVIYVSAEFDSHFVTLGADEAIALALVGDDFGVFLEDTYKYQSAGKTPDCSHGFGTPETREDWGTKQKRTGKRIVETTWAPAGGTKQQ